MCNFAALLVDSQPSNDVICCELESAGNSGGNTDDIDVGEDDEVFHDGDPGDLSDWSDDVDDDSDDDGHDIDDEGVIVARADDDIDGADNDDDDDDKLWGSGSSTITKEAHEGDKHDVGNISSGAGPDLVTSSRDTQCSATSKGRDEVWIASSSPQSSTLL